jgi:hypothetical protein
MRKSRRFSRLTHILYIEFFISLNAAIVSAVAHLEHTGPRDPEGNWQDRPCGCYGGIEREDFHA